MKGKKVVEGEGELSLQREGREREKEMKWWSEMSRGLTESIEGEQPLEKMKSSWQPVLTNREDRVVGVIHVSVRSRKSREWCKAKAEMKSALLEAEWQFHRPPERGMEGREEEERGREMRCEAKLPRCSAAAIFISYSDGATDSLLRADFLKTENVTEMFSDVVSGRIVKTPITNLSEPVNFTLKHKMSKANSGLMTCVYWKVSGEEQFWSVEGCTATFSNATYTVCSCTHLSTFALIMQTERVVQNDDLLDQINKVLVIIGLFFLALSIITFVFCRWNPKINNTARLNLCICLFLAHLIFLVAVSHTENKVICSIIAGVLHYLFLSAFVWMLLESIQLFLLVRSLTKVRIIHREGLRPLYLLLIGYSIPVVVVGVSAGLFPRGYGDDKICWLKNDKGFKWTFLGPVCCILAVNLLLFGAILWNVRSTLVNMKSDISQVKDTRIIIFKAIVQFVILGCGWLLGFFPGTPLLSYLFIVLNSQQGTFIFIVHCLLNKEGFFLHSRSASSSSKILGLAAWLPGLSLSVSGHVLAATSLAAIVAARRKLWLSQARQVPEADRTHLMDAPLQVAPQAQQRRPSAAAHWQGGLPTTVPRPQPRPQARPQPRSQPRPPADLRQCLTNNPAKFPHRGSRRDSIPHTSLCPRKMVVSGPSWI
ncbi:adhesion G protein-coupled receptor E1-like [Amia ocellicauda]|uniref:adhesion G protein-coupled receptor E1-like n=1 Tax=Amia ocellicauda TaxID=2972642 RepID=UPI003464D102